MTPSHRIVAASEVGALTRLEPLARAIFGEGNRGAGWFERKIRRECVDPRLSRVVLGEGLPDDPTSWLGYALVGTPASVRPAVRTSGIGVVEHARGLGLGRRLLDAVAEAAAAQGFAAIRTPSTPEQVAFYRGQGYARRRETWTLLATGRGTSAPTDAPAPWDAPDVPEGVELAGWLPEAWARTPATDRRTLTVARDSWRLAVHVSREGRAWVGHRVLASRGWVDHHPDDAIAQVDAMLDRFPIGTPVLMAALDPVSSITHLLQERGWSVAQKGELMERHLASEVVPRP